MFMIFSNALLDSSFSPKHNTAQLVLTSYLIKSGMNTPFWAITLPWNKRSPIFLGVVDRKYRCSCRIFITCFSGSRMFRHKVRKLLKTSRSSYSLSLAPIKWKNITSRSSVSDRRTHGKHEWETKIKRRNIPPQKIFSDFPNNGEAVRKLTFYVTCRCCYFMKASATLTIYWFHGHRHQPQNARATLGINVTYVTCIFLVTYTSFPI